jgi:hypothetical protein
MTDARGRRVLSKARSIYVRMEQYRVRAGGPHLEEREFLKKTLHIMQTPQQKWPTYKIRLHFPDVYKPSCYTESISVPWIGDSFRYFN